MSHEIQDLGPDQLRRLGSAIADLFSPGGGADRRALKSRDPDLADVLDSVFGGLDAWNALNASSNSSGSVNGGEELAAHQDPVDREDLPPGFVLVPSMDSRLTSGFKVVERIGQGGSGVVYRARLPREVRGRADIALKVLRRGDALDVSRSFRDAQILKGLHHPNLVRVYAAGESLGLGPFVATEFIEGLDLADWLDRHGPLDPRRAAEIVRRLARALGAAHEEGVVHCDVTPRNVFGCDDGLDPALLKIGDFGLARFAPLDPAPAGRGRPLDTGGTVGFMAPEQYWGDFDARSDIYALGMLLVCMINSGKGQRGRFLSQDRIQALKSLLDPHAQAVDFEGRRRQILETFRASGLETAGEAAPDAQFRAIVGKCLALEPADRYASAAQLADDLELWLERRPLRHASYDYRNAESLRMLIARCRERDNVEDHSLLWGLAGLLIGATSVIMSTLCTILGLFGHIRDWTWSLTSGIYIVVTWGLIAPLTAWSVRGRRPTVQLFGYQLIFALAYFILRTVIVPDFGPGNGAQFLITGIIYSCIGLSNPQWGLLLKIGLGILVLSWPAAVAFRQPWFTPFIPMLQGWAQGLPVLAFGASYLRRARSQRDNP